MRHPSDLHPYQRDAVEWLHGHPGSALFCGVGRGKTVITLTLLARLKAERAMRRALIVGPLRVVNTTWPDEIAAWSHTAGLTHKALTGTAKARALAVCAQSDVHLINREMVAWLVGQFIQKVGGKWKLVKPWPYDTVICDEMTGFGDAGSERFKSLARARQFIARFHGLTATPTAEGYMKMFAMTYLLDQGERFGRAITRYRETYYDHNEYTHQWTIKPGADRLISAKIADIAMTIEDGAFKRDDPTIVERRVRLSSAEMDFYRQFERDAVAEMPDGAEIEAVHAAALATKLLQLSSGFVYDADRQPHWSHDHKTAELVELVEELQGEPLIVAYWFQPSLAKIRAAFPAAVPMDKEGKAVEAWNAGRIKMLLVHPQSAGMGLNLQRGGAKMAFYDLPASYELYHQVVGRIDRQGQTKEVTLYPIIVDGTADEIAIDRLKRKESVHHGFFDLLRSHADQRHAVPVDASHERHADRASQGR